MSELASIQTRLEKTGTDVSAARAAAAADIPDDNTCVVCFKNVEIYSIGECDHPVCYECSTRMRVLCQQNECPICRQVLSKVIFTYDKLPYRELEAKNRSEYYSKKYKIGFYTQKIQQKFFNLLDHPCPICNAPPYRTFQGLKNHVRKEHDMHYCDLCTENLKIFTFERNCYTQAELGLHRAKGDANDRSHRGHPLCEYCKRRYLDQDELFRHLRREHYFCHFCDADGCNEFYKDYDALAEHFRRDHFLCEEGKCATEQFVGAFRTEIDYKAHVASVHGKMLNKQQAKQTRTLQLEITLGPRERAGQNEHGIASVRSRANEEHSMEPLDMTLYMPQQNQRSITIDACNEQDFPSLSGAASGPSVTLIRPPPQSMRNRSAVGGLARTKENFPALGAGGSGGGGVNVYTTQRALQAPPISSVIRKPPNASTGAIARSTTNAAQTPDNNSSMLIHVSNRPSQNGANAKKANALDFPALSLVTKNKKNGRLLDEDFLPPSTHVPLTNLAAKHRTLIDDYVSVANPSNFQKIQMVQKEELDAKARKLAEQANAPKLTTHDFPTLGGTSASSTKSATPNSWTKAGGAAAEKKQRELENRKSKVAAAPLLPKQSKPITTTTTNSNNSNGNSTSETTIKKEKKKKSSPENSVTSQTTKTNSKIKEKSNNNIENKSANANLVNGNYATAESVLLRAPPGFIEQNNAVKPPPGFHSNVTVNSVAKSPNNLTFTTSLGESYNIVPVHAYAAPSDAMQRTQKLVGQLKASLQSIEAFEEFRYISQKFSEGTYKTQAYYEHCQAALKDKFDQIFPELLALLPDISKQQALYLVHTQRLNTMSPNQRKSLPKLEVCATCKQILLCSDLDNHRELHELKDQFPKLGSGTSSSSNIKTAQHK